MTNSLIRALAALTGGALVVVGVLDGMRNIMPDVAPMDLIYVGAALLGVAAVPRVSGKFGVDGDQPSA